jgi:hypothetical protein
MLFGGLELPGLKRWLAGHAELIARLSARTEALAYVAMYGSSGISPPCEMWLGWNWLFLLGFCAGFG